MPLRLRATAAAAVLPAAAAMLAAAPWASVFSSNAVACAEPNTAGTTTVAPAPTPAPVAAPSATATAGSWTPPFSLQYLGQQSVPTGTLHAGTPVGGLSGLEHDPATGLYLALSDDRSTFAPARFYTLRLDLARFRRSPAPGMAGVEFVGVTTLQTPAGQPFAPMTVDPEGIRRHPASGLLYWSNEGQRTAAGFQAPTVREMNADGTHRRDFAVPRKMLPAGSPTADQPGDRGVAHNLAFESLALSPDGRTLYAATENALAQDGPVATLEHGSPARIVAFDVASGEAREEWIIDIGPVVLPPRRAGGFATNGLTELLALGGRQFIAVERSYAAGASTPGTRPTGHTVRLYHLDATEATDVSGLDSIRGVPHLRPVRKRLLLDLSTLLHDDGSPLAPDNIEGLALGPSFEGDPTLVLVADNNFSGAQSTQFIALRMVPVAPPLQRPAP